MNISEYVSLIDDDLCALVLHDKILIAVCSENQDKCYQQADEIQELMIRYMKRNSEFNYGTYIVYIHKNMSLIECQEITD